MLRAPKAGDAKASHCGARGANPDESGSGQTVGLHRMTVPGLTNSVVEATKPRARRFPIADVKLKRDVRRMVDSAMSDELAAASRSLSAAIDALRQKRVGPAGAGTRRGAGADGTIAA